MKSEQQSGALLQHFRVGVQRFCRVGSLENRKCQNSPKRLWMGLKSEITTGKQQGIELDRFFYIKISKYTRINSNTSFSHSNLLNSIRRNTTPPCRLQGVSHVCVITSRAWAACCLSGHLLSSSFARALQLYLSFQIRTFPTQTYKAMAFSAGHFWSRNVHYIAIFEGSVNKVFRKFFSITFHS